MLLVVAWGGAPVAAASVSFVRVDIPLSAAPDSVALGDLDGQHGKDIVVALPAPGKVGVLRNQGDGTFSPMQEYSAGAGCVGAAVDITLGDVTTPAPGDRLRPDGKLDAYVACTPDVVRLTGNGAGVLGNPEPINLGVAQYLGSATLDMLTLTRRPDGNPVPLLVFQRAAGSSARELCISYELSPDPAQLVCDPNHTPVEGPLAVGDLNGSAAGVPPDEIVTSEGGDQMGVFGFGKPASGPLTWSDGTRTVPAQMPAHAAVESAALGDLDDDGDLDVVTGQPVNSAASRVPSIHYFKWGAGGLDQVATPLPSTPGVDAVSIADVDGDGCNDVLAGGTYGTGMIHLGDGAGFDGGRDLEQLGYHVDGKATRVTMAVDDLDADGHPDIVMSDNLAHAVMVFRNDSASPGAPCAKTSPPPPSGPGPSSPSPPPPPPPPAPVARSCASPGTAAFAIASAGADVLVGTNGRDTLSGRGGDDCLFGRAGDDRLSGGTGADVLRGSTGKDRIHGDAGADRVDGGSGNDDLTPGAGRDKVTAGGGNDKISARDGARDTIDCGSGRDRVTADRTDKVKRNCEDVTRRAARRA
jgi:hypothetical protein